MPRLPQPEAGTVTFEALAEIAVGATARVDLCRALSPPDKVGRLLAVKRLHPHIAEDPQFADMFFDEVWLSAALRHKNVVEVEGWGTDEHGTFLAVELVQGVSLSRLMKTVFDTGEVFSERMVVYIASQLCQGLAAAHDLRSPEGELLNLVHRDLTPGNILAGFDGSLKITDFGLAKAKQRVTKTLTGLLKGSPQYMSPEQSRGHEIDRRSDLFSLGVVLFELFSGKRPWFGMNELQAMHEAQSEPPLDLFQLRPRIDKELVTVVVKLLQKAPDDRFQTADEVGERMGQWLAAHGYKDGNQEALARFVRRNAMRQMRWFERAIAGEITSMPDSMRPSRQANRLSAVPSRLSALSNSGRPVSAGAGRRAGSLSDSRSPPRIRARSRKPLDSETTDVTDADAKIALLHGDDDEDADKEIVQPKDELGDELPTLVQKNERRVSDYRARAREVAAARAPLAPAMGALASAELLADEDTGDELSHIVDEDSDQRTTAVKKHRHHTAPTSFEGRAVPSLPRTPNLGFSDPESEEIPTVPMKGKARVADAIDRAVAQARLPGHIVPPSPDVPPPPVRVPPSGERAGGRQAPLDFDERFLLEESDRLALEAVRYNEESRAAAAQAVRRATVAKLANEASMLAAEAVRVVALSGLSHAKVKLEQAYALEESMKQAEAAAPPSSFPPPPLVAPPPVSAIPASPRDPYGRDPFSQNGDGQRSAPPDELMISGEFARPSLFDPGSFRSRLRPTVLGMPTLVALALAAFGVAALVVVLVLIIA